MSNYPKWLETAVFYEIYPQSFYDTNGDGIGDIPGIIEKLDYIGNLGCNAIWLNPCFESPFGDAGYDVSDYYKVAPRYGTNQDLVRLFEGCHRRGMRVCLDLVPGHTSIEHPWFQQSARPERNQYTNWYIWSTVPWNRDHGGYFIAGYGNRHGSYMPNFFYHQPALNYGFGEPDPTYPWELPVDHPDVQAVREEMKNVIRFWLDMGADGFRVDMASSLVKNDPGWKATSALWQDVRAMLDEKYPEAVLISEWSSPREAIGAGFHVDFILHFGELDIYNSLFRMESSFFAAMHDPSEHSFFRKDGGGDICRFLKGYMEHYGDTAGRGFISIVSGNHDVARLAKGRDADDLEVAFAFMMTMPGVPFIYYGDEIGMDFVEGLHSKEGGYERTGSRTPMQWSHEHNAGFSSGLESSLYLPIDPSPDAPTVEDQTGRGDSLLETIRSLIEIRQANPALGATGDFCPLYAEAGQYPFVYKRSLGGETIVVAVNPVSQSRQLSLKLSAKSVTPLISKGAALTLDGGCLQLSMDGVSYGVFRIG